jgi:cardiolipin synthase
VGTVNLDYRSLYLNFECGVYLYGSSAVMAIKNDFLDSLEKCVRIDREAIRHKLPLRLAQSILRLFAPML